MNTEASKRVADAITSRRKELNLTQDDLARRANIDVAQVRALEAGQVDNYRLSVLTSMEYALNWEQGAIQNINGDPIVTLSGAGPADTARLITERLIRDLRAEATFLDEARYHATPAEDTAAAEALRAVADRLEAPIRPGGQVMNGVEFLLDGGPQPMPACTPVDSRTELGIRHTSYDGKHRDEFIGEAASVSLPIARALADNEPTGHASGTKRVDLVQRTVTKFADGGFYFTPWTVVETKEG